MKKRILFYLIVFQLSLVLILGHQIYKKKTSILGIEISINSINILEQIFPKVDGLNYFYEPKPGSVNRIQLEWENINGPKNPTYMINSDGLNQLDNYDVNKPESVFRIITLGDSFTFGRNVNTEDNYPSQLEDLLTKKLECTNKKFQVLNFGVGGYDIQYVVERYKLRAEKYSPDLVLWFIIDDDLRRINELLVPRAKQYEQQMKETGEYRQSIEQGDFYPHWVKARNEIINELGGEGEVIKLQENFLREFNLYYNSGKMVVFTFPFSKKKYKNVLRSFANSRSGISFYDGIPKLTKEGGELLPDYHPSPKGYKRIADALFDYLTKTKLIPCG